MFNVTNKPTKRRTTKFTAALVALSLGVSGLSAAPARADDADVARAIGGLLTLFVIGKAIEQGSSKSKATSRPAENPSRPARPHRERRSSFEIPNTCVVSFRDSRSRSQNVALKDCMQRERHAANALPRACETSVKLKRNNKRSEAYDVGCLNNFGYRVSYDDSRRSGRALR
ncbi:hypothetical protein EDD53_2590 [Pacificibacter maritimus]|uniref:Uncharacterized protein n=1 Tax=Pacificibacter maritimus TaxID=762213 RepID=A0A3N4U1W2_9RHOB|nr:hypothetical protein [Pacificibacter maritimus]RPE64826.1 hypothetical protein EDD53_2590 [Pacificibacter maritimus]